MSKKNSSAVSANGNLIATAEDAIILTGSAPETDASGNIILPQEDGGNWVAELEVSLLHFIKYTAPPAGTDSGYNVSDHDIKVSNYGDLAAHATLYKVRFTDMAGTVHEYTVGQSAFAAGLLVLESVFAAGDKLTINDNGNYVYQTKEGASFANVNIKYFTKEPGSEDIDSAMLYIRSDAYRHDGVGLDQSGAGDQHSHVIIGTGGDDVIHASDGNGTIYGGAGSDIFVWSLGDYDDTDKNMDITPCEDP